MQREYAKSFKTRFHVVVILVLFSHVSKKFGDMFDVVTRDAQIVSKF